MKQFDEHISFFDERSSAPYPSVLYRNLQFKKHDAPACKEESLGEGMMVISEVIAGYWKPRFLLNHASGLAYEFMNKNEHLLYVGDKDIDWDSLERIPERDRAECVEMAKSQNAMFPTFIREYSNGVARVDWQLQPNGYYWRDDDGFGMTGDEEITVYGFIDTSCQVVLPFRTIRSYDDLKTMRSDAELTLKRKNGNN